jgi:hypothetical protein
MNDKIKITLISGIVSIAGAFITVYGTIHANVGDIHKNQSEIDRQKEQIKQISVPVGTIVAYAGSITDEKKKELDNSGWLICDGSLVPEGQKYEDLGNLLGQIWGAGRNLPDLRGMFLRGVDPGGKNDPDFQSRTSWQGELGPKVGSSQRDMFLANHARVGLGSVQEGGSRNSYAVATAGFEHDLPSAPEGGHETRPKNVYVYYLIKY